MAQWSAHSPQDTLHQSVVCSMDIVPGSARMLWLQGLEVEVILRTIDYFVFFVQILLHMTDFGCMLPFCELH